MFQYKCLAFLVFIFTNPVSTAEVDNITSYRCSVDEFRCGDGTCVGLNSLCDGTADCVDLSDERACSGQEPTRGGKCKLPPYPQYGTYVVSNVPGALPGESYSTVHLNISCNPGFTVEKEIWETIYCHEGIWSNDMPKCVRFCSLNKHPSVEYRCISTGAITGSRECGSLEPAGTVVQPNCRTPNYYYPGVLSNMICDDGSWNYIAVCKPECGTITPLAKPLTIEGRTAKKGELPWYAGIYVKTYTPPKQICGGSLISTTAVISAANCFWSDLEKNLPAANYAVAVGKLYRHWNNVQDEGAQKSDVAEIKLTSHFEGAAANYQDDIAIVIVVTPFVYQPYIRPVCINFDMPLDLQQVAPGNMGKVAGWGVPSSKGGASQILKVVEMAVLSKDECRARSPVRFRKYLTSDKICAGYTNGTTLCEGDSGSGLAFPSLEQGLVRYYLRGVVSVSSISDDTTNECPVESLILLTHVTNYEYFIKQYL